jgi:hypothetical protein
LSGPPDHRLLELHLDEPPLRAELDDVALDLDGHPRHQLGALEDRQDVVQRDAALELERGQAGGDLVEAGAVLVERRERLVGLGEDRGDLLEDVLGAVDVQRDDLAPLGDRRSRARRSCLETRSAVRWRVPVSAVRIVGSGISWTLHQAIFVAVALSAIAPSIFASW